jgi:Uma2 family endonuclease
MTVEDFLAWLETRPRKPRYELIAGEPVEMSAERVRHAMVKGNVWLALRQAIETAGIPYTALADGVAVRIDGYTVLEPDASIAANASLDPDGVFAPEPVIVVEVLSPSTAMRDASVKLEDYFRVPTIAHYLVIDPDREVVFHHRRAQKRIETEIHHQGRLRLEPPGIVVEVRDFFPKA